MLTLFLHFGCILSATVLVASSSNDSQKEKRDRSQWLRAITAYLNFQSGDAWRRLSDPGQRWDPDRLWYQNGLYCLTNFLADTTGSIALVTPSPKTPRTIEEQTDDLRALKLQALPRASLVALLIRADLKLTDRKILMHLSRSKLARMLVAAQNANADSLERIA